MSKLRLPVLVALLAGAVGCTHAPWNPYGGWSVVKTKHIALYTNTPPRGGTGQV